ncbi:hypothetical protein IE81DRAFT_72842 [Ceraceosorus guamensis]|uniref:Uncharacterized protein n=1 Tax=Ceraceosorus guamensis TaxID=1522189 RepID=A0A316W4Q7_9BASI|nr:hypothetical protein IE81DRAFT_72842 [Ceraceosorus guamensis]PWN43631.1 hypothetical protein IE81DRAFT_72842 [Ceraceosorus guamensis]
MLSLLLDRAAQQSSARHTCISMLQAAVWVLASIIDARAAVPNPDFSFTSLATQPAIGQITYQGGLTRHHRTEWRGAQTITLPHLRL